MSRFHFYDTPLAGAYVVEPRAFQDERGYFERLFCRQEFQALGLTQPIVQMNHSMTAQHGAMRGMHFQYPPYAETKIVRCLRGAIFDVAVDIRAGSPTFLHWHAEILSSANRKMLYLPEGCAHGFQALEEQVELLYLHTAAYAPQHEGGLRWNDPTLAIAWPLAPADISERDQRHGLIDADFRGIVL